MMAAKRSYGTGSVHVRTNAGSVEHFDGAWEGLTQKQAEANLRRLMADEIPGAALGDRKRKVLGSHIPLLGR